MRHSLTTDDQDSGDTTDDSQADAAEFELLVSIVSAQDGASQRKLLDLALNLAARIRSSPYETFRRAMVLYAVKDLDFSNRALQFAREIADQIDGREGFPAWLELAVVDQTHADKHLSRVRKFFESIGKSFNDDSGIDYSEMRWREERALGAAILAMLALDTDGADTLRAIEFGLHWWSEQKYRPEFMDSCVAWLPDSALPKAAELLSKGGCEHARRWLERALAKRTEQASSRYTVTQPVQTQADSMRGRCITQSQFANSISSLLNDVVKKSTLGYSISSFYEREILGQEKLILGDMERYLQYAIKAIEAGYDFPGGGSMGDCRGAKRSGQVPALESTLDSQARRDRRQLIELLTLQLEDIKNRGGTDAILELEETLIWTRQSILDAKLSSENKFFHASDLAEAVETVQGEAVYSETSGSRQRFIPNPRYHGELPAEDLESQRRRLEAAEEPFVPVSRGIEVGEPMQSTELQVDALSVFVDDLTQRFGTKARMVNDFFAGLAWGEGKGLTRRAWPSVASALSETRTRYGDGDLTWVLEHAGRHIIEAGEDGQAVYRLAHQSFADHYRTRADSKYANARITKALAAGIKGEDWLDADAYLWRHLASHAAAGEVLDELVADPGYLAMADPIRLGPVLATVAKGRAREIADVYWRIGYELAMREPLERIALIHLVACQEVPTLAPHLQLAMAAPWRCRWAHWMQFASNRIVGRHKDTVHAVALGEVDGKPVVVSGSDDKTVQLWDAHTGRLRGQPLTGHTGRMTAVALGEVDGEPVVVSGSWDETVRLWDARTGRPRGEPLGYNRKVVAVALGKLDGEPVVVSGHLGGTVQLWDARTGLTRGGTLAGGREPVRAVALREMDGEPVVISGSSDSSNATAHFWDARTGRPHGQPQGQRLPLSGHTGLVQAVALGEVDGEPVVVSGSLDDTVRLWDARTGRPRGRALTGHTGRVAAVALGEVDGEPVVVSGSYDKTVRLWDARTGRPRGKPLTGHTGQVVAVALGEVNGEPVVVSGGLDGTVRLWDARISRTGACSILAKFVKAWLRYGPADKPLSGQTGPARAVALGEVDGKPVVVSASGDGMFDSNADHTVRLWDARTGRSCCGPLTGHTTPVKAVALGKVDGEPVVVSGAGGLAPFPSDRTVRLWDARTGRPRGQPLVGHTDAVFALALGEVDGEPMVLSGSRDKTVRLWDARTGRPRGQPLDGHTDAVLALALGEVDGEPVVVSGSYDKTVRLWDARTGQSRDAPLIGHTEPVTSVALGEVNGEPVVVSGSYDKTVRLWDARTGRSRDAPLIGHTEPVTSVALGEVNGEPVVVSGSLDETVRLWDARFHRLFRIVPLRAKVFGLDMGKHSTVVVGTDLGLLVLDF